MEPVIKEITVQTDEGAFNIKAGVFGPVAVHKSIGFLDKTIYTITHIATGRSLSPCHGYVRDYAIRIATNIGSQPIWDFKTLDEFKAIEKQLKYSLEAAFRLAGRESHEAARRGDGGPMPRRALPEDDFPEIRIPIGSLGIMQDELFENKWSKK